MGVVRLKQGDAAGAEALLREAVTGLRSKPGKDDWSLAVSRMMLGEALVDLGRFGEAETELLESERVFAAVRPPKAPRDDRPICIRYLVAPYEAWDKAEPGKGMDTKAATWKAQLIALPAPEPGAAPLPANR